LESEISTWKARVQQLLDKYQRIDPETHKKLQDDHQSLLQQLTDKQVELDTAKQDLTKFKNIKAQALKIQKKNEELLEQVNQATAKIETESKVN
jgi:predicted  nucleic acid-binding Zn-ribbon protein